MKIYSIGYGLTRSPETMIEQLRKRGVKVLFDCRSQPFSGRNPQFSRNELQRVIEQAGIIYNHRPDLGGLGGFGDDFNLAVSDLAKNAKKDNPAIVLMCSELDPRQCHRYQKIGEDLSKAGVTIVHIDKDDSDWEHPRRQQELSY